VNVTITGLFDVDRLATRALRSMSATAD